MTRDSHAAFGDLLRQARRHAGLTQEALAERAGISHRAVSSLERGINRAPRRDTLELLCTALDLIPEERRVWERARRRLSARVKPDSAAGRGDLPERLPPPFSTLIGREREQTILADFLEAALDGRGSLVLVSGEAGIGKTTLVRNLSENAENQGALVLSGGCYALTATPPYGPWVQAIREYRPIDGQPPVPDWFNDYEKLAQIRSQTALLDDASRFFIEIAKCRTLIIVLEDMHWADPASLEALRYLGRHLSKAPLLIAVTYRTEQLTAGDDLARLLPFLVRESRAQRVHLNRLDREAIHEFVESRYQLAPDDFTNLVEHVWKRSEGNPFFADEILRGLEDERVLRPGAGGWGLGDLDQVLLPVLLHHLLGARVSQLSPETREALQIASVIGQEMSLGLWQSMTQLEHTQLTRVIDEAIRARMLEELPGKPGFRFRHALLREALYESLVLTQRQALHRQAGEVLALTADPDPDAVAHHFQHAGDQRVVQWLLRAGLRARRSAAWFTAAERLAAAAALLETNAPPDNIRGWLLFYITFLRRFSGSRDAMVHLVVADRLAAAAGDAVLAAYIRHFRGTARCMSGDVRRGMADIRAGVAALDELSHTYDIRGIDEYATSVIQSLLSAPGPESRPTMGPQPHAGTESRRITQQRGVLVAWLASSGHFSEAVTQGEAFLAEVTTALGDDQERLGKWLSGSDAYGALGLGIAYAALGFPDRARRQFVLAQNGFAAIGDHQMEGDAVWNTLLLLTIPYRTDALTERGELLRVGEQASIRATGATLEAARPTHCRLIVDLLEARWMDARTLTDQGLRSPMVNQLQFAIASLGLLARYQGETALAWEQVRKLLPQGPETEPGDSCFGIAIIGVALAAELSIDDGDLALARRWIETHDRWITWSGAKLWQAENQLLWTRFHERSGDVSLARRHAERGLTLATLPRQPLQLVAAHRMLGNLDRQEGHHDRADTHLDASVTLAEACAAPFERAQSMLALAELGVDIRDSEGAQSPLDEARSICQSLGARPMLQQITTLEAEAPASASALSTSLGGLTVREIEIFKLLAAGKSNQKIADAMFLSPRTVERHIANIYVTIDVHNEVEGTAYALRHHLV